MKNITVTDCKRKLTLDDISQLERELEVILPSDYKEFLLKNNGGHPIKNIFDARDDDLSSSINIFNTYAVENYYNDIVGEYGLFKDRIPIDFIPIADDPGGNLICLGVGNNFGKVYFWDHEEEADGDFGEEPSFNNMYKIADNFANFINSLYKFEIVDLVTEDETVVVTNFVSTHDRYSLPFSTEAKKYGAIVTDFFAKAPSEVEDYVIEYGDGDEHQKVLRYDEPSSDTRICRRINADGSFEDFTRVLSKELAVEERSKPRTIYVKSYDKYAMLNSREVRRAGAAAVDFFAAAPMEVRRYTIVTKVGDQDVIFRYDVPSSDMRFCRKINADGSFEDYSCVLSGEAGKDDNSDTCIATVDTYDREALLNSPEAKLYGDKFTGFIKEAASEVELFSMEKREPGGVWLSYERVSENTEFYIGFEKCGRVHEGSSKIVLHNGEYN